ncbi:MAG: sulfite exporter TauE/SafE family protein [Verrucomicrobiales bacterium]|nr:sulfite exporter TauE/SafE family protein [Verrucomicrobiales bacterium]
METWQYVLLTGVGLVAGVINVIAGGGSLLTLPVMILMGLPAPVANGTNRVAIFAQNIVAVSAFRSKGLSDFKLSLTLALCTIPGGIAGAWCGAMIRGELFNRILAVIMIGVVILMATKKKAPAKTPGERLPQTRGRLIAGHLCMIVVGFYGGFIQAGVGFLIMAALNRVMRLDLVQVNMHKVFIVGAFTLAALAVYIVTGNVWWIPGVALALGNSIGGWIGSHLTISKGEVFVQRILYAALIIMAIKLIFY